MCGAPSRSHAGFKQNKTSAHAAALLPDLARGYKSPHTHTHTKYCRTLFVSLSKASRCLVALSTARIGCASGRLLPPTATRCPGRTQPTAASRALRPRAGCKAKPRSCCCRSRTRSPRRTSARRCKTQPFWSTPSETTTSTGRVFVDLSGSECTVTNTLFAELPCNPSTAFLC